MELANDHDEEAQSDSDECNSNNNEFTMDGTRSIERKWKMRLPY